MANTITENKERCNEPLKRLEIASVCLLVEVGMDPQDAYNLISELKEFSPEYYRRIQECTGLYIEARFALIHLLEEMERTKPLENTQNRETLTDIPYGREAITNADIQTGALETAVNDKLQRAKKALNENSEKIEETVEKQSAEESEEKILEELHKITQKWGTAKVSQDVKEETINEPQGVKEETIKVSQDVKEDIPAAEHIHVPEHTSQGVDLENKVEIEKWLSSTEHNFSEMPVEMQEEITPRYIQLRTLVCKDKKEISPSCIGCLIGNTIDCPLFNLTSKKR